jgi:hypothetical protein
VTSAVEIARQEWEESNRRVEASAGDRRRYRQLLDQVAAVTDELRRRVGQTFTLAELADEYRRADDWVLHVLLSEDEDESVRIPATVAVAQGAAFHLYARGAVDYAP